VTDEVRTRAGKNPLNTLEHFFKTPVEIGLFFFGLAA